MPIGQSNSMFTMGASQYPTLLPRSSVLHPMTRKPIKISHLEVRASQFSYREERGVFQRSYERGYTGVSYAEVFFIEKPDTCKFSSPFSSVVIIVFYIYLCNLNKPYMSYFNRASLALLIFILNVLKNKLQQHKGRSILCS